MALLSSQRLLLHEIPYCTVTCRNSFSPLYMNYESWKGSAIAVPRTRTYPTMLAARAARSFGCRGLAPRVPLQHRLPAPLLQASRWLSSAEAPPVDVPGSDAAPATGSESKFRMNMMRALKERRYDDVLSAYEKMVEAGVTPDLLALNCIIEAKAHNEGTAQARETLQV